MLPYRFFLSCALVSSLVLPSHAVAFDCIDPGLKARLSSEAQQAYTIVQGDIQVPSQYKIPQTRYGGFIWYSLRRERSRMQSWQGHLTGTIISKNGSSQTFDDRITFVFYCLDEAREHGYCGNDLQVRRQQRSDRLLFLQRSESGDYEIASSPCGEDEFEASAANLAVVQQCLDAGGC